MAFVIVFGQHRFFSDQGLAGSPTIWTTAQVGPVHFDIAESARNGFARLIRKRHNDVPNNNFFASRDLLGFGFGAVFRRVEWPSTTIVPKYDGFFSAKGPRFRIQDLFIGKRFSRQREYSTNPLGGNFSLIVASYIKRSGHRNVSTSHVRETGAYGTEERCGYRTAHNLLREFVGFAHFARLNTGEGCVGEQNQETDEFDRSVPRFLFDSVAKVLYVLARLTGIALSLAFAIGCAGYGLAIIHKDVPRQPDQATAWRTLWLAIAVIVLGQASTFLAFYLMGLWS
jgi:hypothetical protein